jgi:hypothetical protein
MIQRRPGPNPSLKNKVRRAQGRPAYKSAGMRKPPASYAPGQGPNGPSGQYAPGTGDTGVGAYTPPAPPANTLNDSGYNTDLAKLRQNFGDTNLALDNKQYGIRESFGFDPEFAQNPYTRANLLAKNYQQSFDRSGNSYAARGQLYSGALDRQRTTDSTAYGGQLDSARRQYNEGLSGVQASRLAARRTLEQGMSGAYQDMLDRSISNDPDSSQFSGGGDPYPARKRKPGKKRRHK